MSVVESTVGEETCTPTAQYHADEQPTECESSGNAVTAYSQHATMRGAGSVHVNKT